MIIQHNMAAANTNRQLGITTGNIAKSTEKLSSGFKINRAGDNAAGLTISEKMRAQIRGLEQASANAQDGISLIQTAEGALNETQSILQRMRELAVQASNDTNVSVDRVAIQKELTALTAEVDRIADSTQFNKMNLLDGTLTDKNLQVGANENQNIGISIGSMKASTLGLTTDAVKVDSHTNAEILLPLFKEHQIRYPRLDPTQVHYRTVRAYIANADNTAENLQAAESRIRDVDMAKKWLSSLGSILQQAAQSMLAQANQQTQEYLHY